MLEKPKKSSLIVQLLALLTLLAQGWVMREQNIKLSNEAFQKERQEERELNALNEYGEFILKVMSQCDCSEGE